MPLDAINEAIIESRRVDEDVEVRVDGHWCFGMLAEWRLYESLGWVGWCGSIPSRAKAESASSWR